MRTKKFMYVLLAGAMVLSVVTKTNAKGGENGRFSVGAELGLPMGTYGDVVGIGIGGSLRYEMPMGDNLALMATAGYLSFAGKDINLGAFGTIKGVSSSMIPIQVGAKYYFQEQQSGFYGLAQIGIAMSKSSAEGAKSSSGLTYAPGVGYHLDNLDFGLTYQLFSQSTTTIIGTTATETTSTSGYMGLRIAYVFGEK